MTTNDLAGPWPDVAIPPGELLAETLAAIGFSQTELAKRMGRPVQALNEIIKGKKEITPETALELERVLGTPAHVWLNLERDYRYNKARLSDLERLRRQIPRAAQFPYAQMARLGWVRATRDRLEQVRELLSFFGVAALEAVPLVEAAAYRRARAKEASPEALAAWLRKGELEAMRVQAEPFRAEAARAALPELRAMTKLGPEGFRRPLCARLAQCGVALVFVPHLRGTYASGATRWLPSGRAVVQLSVRNRYDDILWFSLFHELGHLLLHGKRAVFIEADDAAKTDQELEADRFAAEALLPTRQYQRLRAGSPYSRAGVVAFAREAGVAPSIIVGRLQHEGLLAHTHLNGLRTKLEIAGC